MGDFYQCFNFTVGEEGLYTKNAADPGNWSSGQVGVGILGGTKYGITLKTLCAYRGTNCDAEDVECLELSEALDIYKKYYWEPICGDALPQGLAMCTFDCAINSGPIEAIKQLQCAIHVTVDGIMGPESINAAQKYSNGDTVNALLNIRLLFMKSLSTWPRFGRGWANRLADLRCAAL